MRYSHQRELILKEVQRRKDYPTAEQICTSLRAECPRLSLGTVYRDLNTLVEVGKIRRVSIPGEADRFDSKILVHQHFFCNRCGKVTALPIADGALRELIDSCPGFQVEDYMLTVFGFCADCAKKEQDGDVTND
ncbi:MAG: transcriptional repressor [Gemmiger sp.]|nr:transcriptional repressor [Gemmiger sp.]